MKESIYLLIVIFLVGISCEDQFLDENPRSTLNPVEFYNNEDGLTSGLNSAYANLRPLYGEQEHPFRLTILGTDLFSHGKAEVGLPFVFYDTDLNSFSEEVDFLWSSSYENINLTNTIVESAPNVEMNEGAKQQIVAEARFIRALSYFWLVQQFGDVPLNLEPTIGIEREATRTSQDEVYQVIIDDLEFAESNLEPDYSEWGRVRRGAAQHLLSKVYLVMEDWENAADYAQRVINDPTFELQENFADIFHHENQRNSEIIFSVQYENDAVNSGSGNLTHLFFTNSYSDIAGMERVLQWGRPWTRYAPTDYLMGLYNDQSDERTDIWRTFDDFYYNDEGTLPEGKQLGDPIDPEWENTIEFHPALIKYWDPTRPNPNEMRGNKDFIVFRLGESYLIAAEALMRSGQLPEAVPYFNEIRQRASREGEDLSITAGELDVDMILEERARELAGEMHRWFDLVRTGRALEQIRAHNEKGADNIQEHHLLRPIPQNEIDRLSVPMEQNPDY